jgi:hypothetical protein
MFQALADRGMNIQAISTSEIKIAVRLLQTGYSLDAKEIAGRGACRRVGTNRRVFVLGDKK